MPAAMPAASIPAAPRLEFRYPRSRFEQEGVRFELVRAGGVRRLLLVPAGGPLPPDRPDGAPVALPDGSRGHLHPLSPEAADWMRSRFPFLAPCANPGIPVSLGLGDRLGRASAGHLQCLGQRPVFPVLAQQSMRELRLTGRSYPEVLDAATWAVFETGWTRGYGADGDHLKTGPEIDLALASGYTMITLDGSDHIDRTLAEMDDAAIHARYGLLPEAERADLEARYLEGGDPEAAVLEAGFSRASFERTVLTYRGALAHAADMYRTRIARAARTIDYEISIDETATVTTPADHAYVALELRRAGVRVSTLAPRFCGEFQKGIDYRGDPDRFRSELSAHVRIARRLGHRVSVHSGSDKFRIFPLVGEEARDGFHLKTAGTHWLEALRVLAAHEPTLFRESVRVAFEALPDARRFYHIDGDAARIADPDACPDGDLPGYLDQDDARQVLHITYGHILTRPEGEGGTLGDRIHTALDRLEGEYAAGLGRHLERHLAGLGLGSGLGEELGAGR